MAVRAMERKAGQTEFAVYRARIFRFSQNFSDFRSYTANIWNFGPAPSSALIGGRGLGDLEFEHGLSIALFTGLKSE